MAGALGAYQPFAAIAIGIAGHVFLVTGGFWHADLIRAAFKAGAAFRIGCAIATFPFAGWLRYFADPVLAGVSAATITVLQAGAACHFAASRRNTLLVGTAFKTGAAFRIRCTVFALFLASGCWEAALSIHTGIGIAAVAVAAAGF